MELTGFIKKITDTVEKVSKNGNAYQVATLVVETQEKNPNSMAFDLINAQISELTDIGVGNIVKVTYLAHVNEWNGRIFNSFRVVGVERQVVYRDENAAPPATNNIPF